MNPSLWSTCTFTASGEDSSDTEESAFTAICTNRLSVWCSGEEGVLKSVSLRGFWDSVIVSTYLHSFMPQVLRCVVDRG